VRRQVSAPPALRPAACGGSGGRSSSSSSARLRPLLPLLLVVFWEWGYLGGAAPLSPAD
jgi:hypothetical protein